MSVGDRVAWIRDLGKSIEIATWETLYPNDPFTVIQVERNPNSLLINPGDSVWWQGHVAFWTPKSGPLEGMQDIKLYKTTNSYSVPGRDGRTT